MTREISSESSLLGRAGALLIITSCIATIAMAQSSEMSVEFDMPAQSLDQALRNYGVVADKQVMFSVDLVNGKTVGPIAGEMTADEALHTLLADTGLVFETTLSDVILIRTAQQQASTTGGNSLQRVQAQDAEPPQIERVDGKDAEEGIPVSEGEGDMNQQLEEIIVTGTNIRGVENLAAPSLTFSRQEIEGAGFSSLQDAFQALPQNLNEISFNGTDASGVSQVAQFNVERASGISLRGLGPESTLVLINGKRHPGAVQGRVVDISAIPLSATERVEIVTGGRSAVYGSDAVAGVVNLVLRRDFDGAETQLYLGTADDGAERINASQIIGRTFDKGGFLISYDYARDYDLDITEAGRVSDTIVGSLVPVPGEFDLAPDNLRHSVLASGTYEISDSVEVYADGLFTIDENELNTSFTSGPILFENQSSNKSEQINTSVGVSSRLSGDWMLDVSGTYGVSELSSEFNAMNPFSGPVVTTDDAKATLWSVAATAEGALLELGGTEIRAAIGVEARYEDLFREVATFPATMARAPVDVDRDVRSVFAEVLIPLVKNGGRPGFRSLDISAAARYDDYSDFGDTANPQVGVVWSLAEGVNVRAAYSRAFRAPDLFQLSLSQAGALRLLVDPMSDSGFGTVFEVSGGNLELEAEEATTWSVGFDVSPTQAPWLDLSVSYYDIDYENRIDQPATGVELFGALVNEAQFTGLINRAPDADELEVFVNSTVTQNFSGLPFDFETQNLLDEFPDLILFENRFNNIGRDKTSGVDIQLKADFDTRIGLLGFGVNANHIIEFERQATSTSLPFSQTNEPGKPVDTRLRGNINWSRSGIATNVYVNYTDGYTNTLVTPETQLGSFTTIDLAFSIDASEYVDGGVFDGFRLTLNAINVFDKAPPALVGDLRNQNFDGVNANPFGRILSARLVKQW